MRVIDRRQGCSCRDTLNDVVSMGVKHRGIHIPSGMPNQTSHTLWKTFAQGRLRSVGVPKCLRVDPHGAQINKEFIDQAEGSGIFVDPVPVEAHWHMEQVEKPCEKSSHDWNRGPGRGRFSSFC